MTAILNDEPPEPGQGNGAIPAELGRIIRQCLAKNPNQRLQSARDLAIGLRATVSDPTLHRAPPTRPFSLRLVGVIAAALLLVATGTTLYLVLKRGNPEASKVPEEARPIEAVAVLPFENKGGDPKTEPLSEGIPETVIHGLSRLRKPDLKVKSLLSVARYKGRKPELEEVRRELAVGAVVTGTLRLQGDRLIINVSLIDVRDGNEIWGEDYDEKLDDILILQDRISKNIAAKLRLHLTGEEEQRLTLRGTNNAEAFQLYGWGRLYWNKRTPEALTKAIKYFQDAIKLDKYYALAWAGLADAYAVSLANAEARPSAVLPKAKEAAKRALDIDSELAEATATLAVVAEEEWNWSEAERLFKRAIALKPSYAGAHQWYAILLTETGRFDEARAQDRLAQEADPLSLMVSACAGRNLLFAARYDAAVHQLHKTVEMDDFWVAHIFLAEALLTREGKYEEALGELQTVEKLRGEYSGSLALNGRADALLGRRDDALKAIERLEALSRERYVPRSRTALTNCFPPFGGLPGMGGDPYSMQTMGRATG